MTNLQRAALEIKTVGLYNLILEDVQKIAGKRKLSVREIEHILIDHPEILNEYKQLNVEYNLSNIHIKNIPLDNLDERCKEKAKKFNKNLDFLRNIEKYTLNFEQSSTLIIIFSVEFFVLFSVQYFIVLLDLKEWQWWIYAFFALSTVVAWWYAKKEKKKYHEMNEKFEEIYEETLEILEELEKEGCVKKDDLWIMESEDHV